jgi:flagellar hook-basal body complex protein FliE
MSDMNVNQVLAQMRTMSIEAGGKPQPTDGSGDFAAMLKQSIDSVNQSQKTAGALASDFEMGKSDVSLAEVMIASQKASVSFQAMLQVRNKLVDAYKDVMSMPM